ncbi:unnamed protein product [Durusdinium trenchii]|uniref:Uncharacterized protein n=2 Tax=Durusdinium trenchii TaxID=1381693 RepID=A0ABP0LPE8_9DINO
MPSFAHFISIVALVLPAGAIRQKEGEQSGCFKGEGHCCHAKCDGSHEFGDQTLKYTKCEILEGEFRMNGKRMTPGDLKKDGLEVAESDYVCRERCNVEGKGIDRPDTIVYRAGGLPHVRFGEQLCPFDLNG